MIIYQASLKTPNSGPEQCSSFRTERLQYKSMRKACRQTSGFRPSARLLIGLNDRAAARRLESSNAGVRGLFLPDRVRLVSGQGFVCLCLLETGLPQGLGLSLLGEPTQIGGSFLVTSVFQRLRPDCTRRTICASLRFAPEIPVT